MLDEERFALRVTRADLAKQLGSIYPGTTHNLQYAGALEKFVEEVVLAGTAGLSDDERWARVDESTRVKLRQLRGVQQRAKDIKKKLEAGVETLNPVAYRDQLNRIRPVLESIDADLTSSFLSITRARYVTNIRTLVGQSGPVSLDIVVELEGGRSAFPQQVFSEGYKDLIAFLLFLSITKRAAEHGQARVLILDDVLQSARHVASQAGWKYLVLNAEMTTRLLLCSGVQVTPHRSTCARAESMGRSTGRLPLRRSMSRAPQFVISRVAGGARLRSHTAQSGILFRTYQTQSPPPQRY